ncbi:glycosyltransferase family 2 protein [Lactobacillus delbrueckii subsp. lactis]|uniref:glycosyltransferase family 2 protein n=1 Tax=Lactobacillus delbrueckii TaxID=1584 RepID=UPI001E54E617|nr:glycosyltransferase family 2 protein [Lactobacillus delbrueckii]MCD5431409.1 glycosyltransferase family 2 protein [Lactobacillus delbrueckii subsp. lactis]MCD5433234.1 glycosyltransferase family 2 protein [Lactobacillus delbrueckii subsp. lactis]MCD5473013.1 glycosyltransferase family 2 protein [Lactobacillus delbrueckii subsp. lactis]MCJ9699114.1 glycosyltransferase family 2 protein [Lactobacillus delbrueckii subsp. bulgaricus]MCO0824226.1 glycosyltransferase family 2 protein [Lactobacillu
MKVYLILVNYNGAKLTEECIDSIHKSKYDDQYEVHTVVVDNGSKVDETKVLKQKYEDVIFIRSEENLGFAGGNNLGIKRALAEGADYVLLINNDTALDKGMLQELMKNAEPDIVLTGKILYYSKPNTIWCEGGTIDWKKGNSYNGKIGEKDTHNTEKYYCEFASGCCMMIPREIINKIGMLQDDYFMYCEDTEYCLRLKQAGYQIMVVPKAVLYHKVSASSGGEDSPFSTYYITRNRLRLVKEHNELFDFSALMFSLISRYIRMFQFAFYSSKNSKAIYYAIRDFKVGKNGKVSYPKLGI